jgi:hypothetical protein
VAAGDMEESMGQPAHKRFVMAPLGWMAAILMSAPTLVYSSPASRAMTREVVPARL